MDPADGDRIFVADLPAERAWLGEANMMRFRRRPAADNTGLTGDELAVLFVAQANGLCVDATAARAKPRGQDDRSRGGGLRRRRERVLDWKSGYLRSPRKKINFLTGIAATASQRADILTWAEPLAGRLGYG
jgi:hypothetical protein